MIDFNAGHRSSDGGAPLLREVDRHLALTHQLACCCTDLRDPDLIEQEFATLIAQRVNGIALDYKEINHHERLRLDPLFAGARRP